MNGRNLKTHQKMQEEANELQETIFRRMGTAKDEKLLHEVLRLRTCSSVKF